jgi:hypothetical protein
VKHKPEAKHATKKQPIKRPAPISKHTAGGKPQTQPKNKYHPATCARQAGYELNNREATKKSPDATATKDVDDNKLKTLKFVHTEQHQTATMQVASSSQ